MLGIKGQKHMNYIYIMIWKHLEIYLTNLESYFQTPLSITEMPQGIVKQISMGVGFWITGKIIYNLLEVKLELNSRSISQATAIRSFEPLA